MKINLSTIQSAAATKFANFEVVLPNGEEAVFIPVLRMQKAKRLELAAAFDVDTRNAAGDTVTDVYDLYRDALRITARDAQSFVALDQAVGDDPAIWKELFEAYSEETQPGEASSSQD